MIQTLAYGNHSPTSQLVPIKIERREAGPRDVVIAISHCGICHSDIHTARSEWGPTNYPCVPGHEIVGKVTQIGSKVSNFKIGDSVGVGCFVDSCGKCEPCKNNEEQFCTQQVVFTYNSLERDGVTRTLGGYSQTIVVRDKYVLKIKKGLPLERVAPLLCAGITTYSPLKRYKVKKGTRVGVVGLGGLGHMAIKIAKAMGAHVVVFSTSENKRQDAHRLGAKEFIVTTQPGNLSQLSKPLDLIINTVSVQHDLDIFLSCLDIDGTMVLVGVPPQPHQVAAFSLIGGRKKLTGSLIGGIKETQEMLNFCAKHNVLSDIELIDAKSINEAYERTIKADVKYRFVVDTSTI